MTTATLERPPTRQGPSDPRSSADHVWDLGVVLVANVVIAIAMWLRHGGLATVSTPGGPMTAAGQISGLMAMLAVMVELALMARIPWLERRLGFDRLAVLHRWTGFAVVDLVVVHAVTTTLGYAQASKQSVPGQVLDFVRHSPDMLMAIVAGALFVAVGISSMRAARRRLVRETWYSIHLYVYLAIVLSFAHQLAVGSDFSGDAVARWWWGALTAATAAAVLWFRLLVPLAFNVRHRFRVAHVVVEAPGVVSYYVSGRAMRSIRAEAGQFFQVRVLDRDGWWRSNPFSLSATPDGGYLRFTIKALGDHSARLQHVAQGTRVALEGPLGTFTASRRTRPRVALIAGGIGITPLRAMLDDLTRRGSSDVTLLYRVARREDILFGEELRRYYEAGVDVRILVDDQIGDDRTDSLGIPALRRLLPDLASRDVYLCGPPAFVDAVTRRVRRVGVPHSRIHFERFDY
jgi:predicted ferric reductase